MLLSRASKQINLAWSDAAREASAEARRRSMSTLGGSVVKPASRLLPEGRTANYSTEDAVEKSRGAVLRSDHEHAASAHRKAAQNHIAAANAYQIVGRVKVATAHTKSANSHSQMSDLHNQVADALK
jgi:hypothetical protein